MRRASLLLILALVALAGCSGPSPPEPAPPGQDLVLDKNGDPMFEPYPGGIAMRWNFSAAWTRTEPSGDVNVSLIVKLYDRQDTGHDAVTLSFAPASNQTFAMRSPFIGIGDYYYHLTARDASGKVVGTKVGVWETCRC